LTDDAQDLRCRGLPGQRLLGLVEQPRVLDGDNRLVGEALLKRKLLSGERVRAVTMHDENADRLALAPKRRAGHDAGTGAGGRQTGPVGDCGIDIVYIGNVNLPVFEDDRPGQVASANPQLRRRNFQADSFRAGTDVDRPAPFAAAGDTKRDARSAEQAGGGLGDLLQRQFGIARGAGDGAQDFGAAGLAIPDDAQLSLQPGILLPEIGHNVRGKRGHSAKSNRAGPDGAAPNQQTYPCPR
jgi:hypothetical protein